MSEWMPDENPLIKCGNLFVKNQDYLDKFWDEKMDVLADRAYLRHLDEQQEKYSEQCTEAHENLHLCDWRPTSPQKDKDHE